MSQGNGHMAPDKGLAALQLAFEGAQYLDADAKAVAEQLQLGKHRSMNIPDALIMEVYGSITEGKNIELAFTSDDGNGFVANLESYADMLGLLAGTLACKAIIKVGADVG